MPVPVASTHPSGLGLKAATVAELPTEGPFERMARMAREAAANPVAVSTKAADVAVAPVVEASPVPAPGCVDLRHLTFSYPGLGE